MYNKKIIYTIIGISFVILISSMYVQNARAEPPCGCLGGPTIYVEFHYNEQQISEICEGESFEIHVLNENGEPVPGAEIFISDDSSGDSEVSKGETNDEGTLYTIANWIYDSDLDLVEDYWYWACALIDGEFQWGNSQLMVKNEKSLKINEVNGQVISSASSFEFEEEELVSVKVIDEQENPCVYATVSIYNQDEDTTVNEYNTDEDGIAEISIPEYSEDNPTYQIKSYKSGYVDLSTSINFQVINRELKTSIKNLNEPYQLGENVEFTVLVKDQNDDPVKQAEVRFNAINKIFWPKTNDAGEVVFTTPDDVEESETYTITASKNKYESDSKDLEVINTVTKELHVSIQGHDGSAPFEIAEGETFVVEVTQTVNGENPEPVSAWIQFGSKTSMIPSTSWTFIAEPMGKHDVTATKEGYTDASPITVNVIEAPVTYNNLSIIFIDGVFESDEHGYAVKEKHDFTVKIVKEGTDDPVSAFVHTDFGFPKYGSEVTFTAPYDELIDGDGYLGITAYKIGWTKGYNSVYVIDDGLHPEAVLFGKILDSNTDEPIEGAEIYVFNELTTESISDGSYSLALSPGTFTINVIADGYNDQSKEFKLYDGDNKEHDFMMSRGSKKVEGLISNKDKPWFRIPGATVEAINIEDNSIVASDTTGLLGKYEFNIPILEETVEYEIRASHPDFESNSADVNVIVPDDESSEARNIQLTRTDGGEDLFNADAGIAIKINLEEDAVGVKSYDMIPKNYQNSDGNTVQANNYQVVANNPCSYDLYKDNLAIKTGMSTTTQLKNAVKQSLGIQTNGMPNNDDDDQNSDNDDSDPSQLVLSINDISVTEGSLKTIYLNSKVSGRDGESITFNKISGVGQVYSTSTSNSNSNSYSFGLFASVDETDEMQVNKNWYYKYNANSDQDDDCYDEDDKYTVKLKVTTSDGRSDIDTFKISIIDDDDCNNNNQQQSGSTTLSGPMFFDDKMEKENNDLRVSVNFDGSESILKNKISLDNTLTESSISESSNNDDITDNAGITNTCFLEGTKITMADGSEKEIQEIKKGEKVRSYEENNQRFVEAVVSKINIHDEIEYTKGHIVITLEPVSSYLPFLGKTVDKKDTILEVTPNHKIFKKPLSTSVEDDMKALVEAKDIQKGDLLLSENGFMAVKSIIPTFSSQKTYNIELSDYHKYLANGILVSDKIIDQEKDILISDGKNDNSKPELNEGKILFSTFIKEAENDINIVNEEKPTDISTDTSSLNQISSVDPTLEYIKFVWDFGDGNYGLGMQPNHVYNPCSENMESKTEEQISSDISDIDGKISLSSCLTSVQDSISQEEQKAQSEIVDSNENIKQVISEIKKEIEEQRKQELVEESKNDILKDEVNDDPSSDVLKKDPIDDLNDIQLPAEDVSSDSKDKISEILISEKITYDVVLYIVYDVDDEIQSVDDIVLSDLSDKIIDQDMTQIAINILSTENPSDILKSIKPDEKGLNSESVIEKIDDSDLNKIQYCVF